MPVTINRAALKVKNSNGTYVSVDAVSEGTTAEKVAQINQAAFDGVQAINTKAGEVTSQLANAGEMEAMVAPPFASNTAYKAGQYVIHTNSSNVNKLYRFNVDHAANTAWSDSEVSEVKLGNDVTDLKSALNTIEESFYNDEGGFNYATGYINTSGEIGSTVNTTPIENSAFKFRIIPYTTKDIYVITGTGGGSPRLWCFTDGDYKILSHADASATETERTLTNGANGYLIVNFLVAQTNNLVKRTPVTNGLAPINSPVFTGTPTAPNVSDSDNSTKIANTHFVKQITDDFYTETNIVNFATGYVTTSGNVGSVVDTTIQSNPAFCYRIIPYKANEEYIITGTGGGNPRLWCFTDDQYEIISHADGAAVETDKKISSESDGFLIVNFNANQTRSLKKHEYIVDIETVDQMGEIVYETIPIFIDGGGYISITDGSTIENPSNNTYIARGNIEGYNKLKVYTTVFGTPKGLAFYGEDYAFIRGYQTLTQGLSTFDIPANAKYFKLCYQYALVSNNTAVVGRYISNEVKHLTTLDRYLSDEQKLHEQVYFPTTDFCDMRSESDIPATRSGQNAMQTYYDLYDGLVSSFPSYVTKIDCDDIMEDLGIERPSRLSNYPIYAYKFKPPVTYNEFGNSGTTYERYPKILITTGTHPEYIAIYSTYLMMKNICNEWSTNKALEALRFNCEFFIIPCSNPSGVDDNTYTNNNTSVNTGGYGVNLNRNAPVSNWRESGAGTENYTGPSAGSEYENKVLVEMLKEFNPDIYIDHHNSFVSPTMAWYDIPDCTVISEMAHLGVIETTKMKDTFTNIFPSWDDDNRVLVTVNKQGNNYGRGYRDLYGAEQGYISFTLETMQYCCWDGGILYETYKYANDRYLVGIATNVITNTCLMLCQILSRKKLYS